MINKVQAFSQRTNCNPSFQARERVLMIEKPDVFERKLENTLEGFLKDNGMEIVAEKQRPLNPDELRIHYAHVANKSFYPEIEDYMTSGKSKLMIVEGEDIISKGTARKKTEAFRNIFAYNIMTQNLLHCSDSHESANEEIDRFFPELKA